MAIKTKNLLTIGGAILGGAFGGGAPGAVAGMSAGSAIGGMLPEESGPKLLETGPSDALQRRLQKMQDSPLAQIRNSIDHLKYIDDSQIRESLARPLMEAEARARATQSEV